ncbi:iron-containing redox enzyme family protein [Nonomuraea sp. NPDC005650]|uniref:iron-containing redox enzyme family protein n=1 Tax=Nonomuraea sp. NPDC005650 TaxID=3157045 RepID=UPI0033AB4CF4
MPHRTLPGTRLRVLLDVVMPALSRSTGRMWAADPVRDVYLSWLRTSYDMVRATVPLLRAAQEESARRADPISSRLLTYLPRQIRDEDGHDAWVADDYVTAGGSAEDLRERVPSAAVARLVGSQYYWIRHAHPIALLGHTAVLEWYPPPGELASMLARRSGLPAGAFRTLSRHSSLDGGHGEALAGFLDSLPLSAAQRRLLTRSALASVAGLAETAAEVVNARGRG